VGSVPSGGKRSRELEDALVIVIPDSFRDNEARANEDDVPEFADDVPRSTADVARSAGDVAGSLDFMRFSNSSRVVVGVTRFKEDITDVRDVIEADVDSKVR
jgi:hypothetical protein